MSHPTDPTANYLEDPRPAFNPNGLSEIPVNLVGVNYGWIASGTPYDVCFDTQSPPQEAYDALADWENVLPGTQFNLDCQGGSYPFWIYFASSGTPDPGCGDVVACAAWAQYYFPQFGGSYTASSSSSPPSGHPFIWINDEGYTIDPGAALRYVIAHETGHIFGLHEAYEHDEQYSLPSLQCNPDISSVMDMAAFSGPRHVSGPCDTSSPAQRDIALVQSLYYPNNMGVELVSAIGSDLQIQISDATLGESSFGVDVAYFNGQSWQLADHFIYIANIAPKDHELTFCWRKPGFTPDAPYAVCIYANSSVYPPQFGVCSSTSLNLVSNLNVDSDGDGGPGNFFSDLRETGIPACLNTANNDTVDDSLINDGCPVFGGYKEYDYGGDLFCSNNTDDDFDGVVNDGCPQAGSFSEAGIQIGTDPYRKCAATPIASDEPLPDAWPVDFNDDQLVNGSDFVSFNPHMNTRPPDPNYDPRWDLNVNGLINGQDYLTLNPYFGTRCTP